MKIVGCLFLFLIVSFGALGQSVLLEGKVREKNSSTPLIGAVVSALELPDSSIVQQTTTGVTGSYGFFLPANSSYVIRITYVGFASYTSPPFQTAGEKKLALADAVLVEDAQILRAVSVSGRRPSFTQEVDKLSVNVAGSVLTEGNNVLELLERTPGISMQGEGNFSVHGREGARVMMDGRLVYLSGAQLALLLKGMRARDIAKIEVQSSPSARQDAEGSGGVINIVTRKTKGSSRWTGDLFATGTHGRRPGMEAGGGLELKTEKWSAFLNMSHGYEEEKESGYNERIFDPAEGTRLRTRQNENSGTDPGRNYAVRSGLEFRPDTLRTTGLTVNWIRGRYITLASSNTGFFDSDETLLRSTRTRNDFDEVYNNLTFTVFHTRRFKDNGHELKLTADYAPHGNDYDNGYLTTHSRPGSPAAAGNPSARRNVQDLSNTTYTGGVDYTKPLGGNNRLELGWKATYLAINNRVVNDTLIQSGWVTDKTTSNRFRYGQHLQAGYIIYGTKFKKLSVQAGLRGEFTGTIANQVTLHTTRRRHYFNLFPNLFLNYPVSDAQTVRFSYARRIARPGDHDVNVFRGYEDPYNYWEGNADLKPATTHVLEGGYSYDNRLFATLSYNRGTDVIMHIARVGERVGETLLRPENVGRFVNYGVSILYQLPLSSWWESASYLNAFRNAYSGYFGDTVLDNSANSWSANTRHTVTLREDLRLEGVGYYRSGTASGARITAPAYGLDISLNKSFPGKRLTIKLAGTGIIRNARPETRTSYGDLRVLSYTRPDNRRVTLSVNYRFE